MGLTVHASRYVVRGRHLEDPAEVAMPWKSHVLVVANVTAGAQELLSAL